MRIGIFTDTFYPCINGVSASTLYYAQEFVNKGHHVYIFCPKYKGAKKNELHDGSRPGYSVLRCPAVPVPTNPEHSISFPGMGFGVKIKDLKLDVIHIQAPFIMGTYGAKIARKLNIPLTQTYHTLWEQYWHYFMLPEKFFTNYLIHQNGELCNRSMVNFVPSPQIKEILETRYKVTSKLVVCPTGIDIDGFENITNNELAQSRIGIPEDKKILLFASRITKEKSIDVAVEAFAKVLKKVPNAVFVISGEGPFEGGVKKMVKELGIEDKVILKGYLSRSDLYAYYKMADLFVFPSVSETQGLVVIEAQYFETPVVGVAENGVAMLMKGDKGGFLAKKRDAGEVAELCVKLLTDEKLYAAKAREAKENAREWRMSKFADLQEREIQDAVNNYQKK